jgi:hypothetical protein
VAWNVSVPAQDKALVFCGRHAGNLVHPDCSGSVGDEAWRSVLMDEQEMNEAAGRARLVTRRSHGLLNMTKKHVKD